jgi:cytochrome c-L
VTFNFRFVLGAGKPDGYGVISSLRGGFSRRGDPGKTSRWKPEKLSGIFCVWGKIADNERARFRDDNRGTVASGLVRGVTPRNDGKQSTLAAIIRHAFCAAVLAAGVMADCSSSYAIEFRHALDNSPLDLSPVRGEQFTEAVKSFQKTGIDPYRGDPAAIARGKELYAENCQVCHLPDGSGGMGASLIAETPLYPRVATDIGMFEVIQSGASGAMRSFAKRGMTQDDMLAIIAYVRTLKKQP